MPATTPPASDSALDHALALAAAGLRVVPIRRGGKHPPLNSWQHAATTDPDKIRNWYHGLYRDCGVGVVLGDQPDGRHVFAVDLDRHDPDADGHDTLADLEREYGALPDTVRSITGGDGTHILLTAPTGVTVRNQRSDGGRIGPGVDVRGGGGQIVVEPTTHPNGTEYAWEAGHAPWECAIAEAPEWLLKMVVEPEPTTPAPSPRHDLDPTTVTPADALRQHWDWPTELAAAGWTHHHDQGADSHWTRPGKEPREGSSAVLHPGGPFVVFTTEVSDEMRRLGTPTRDGTGFAISPFDFYAATRHGGDRSAASKALLDTERPTATPDTVAGDTNADSGDVDAYDADLLAQLIDWDEFWDQDHDAEEWLLRPILAERRSHAIYAPGGTGKSLFALWLAAQLATGGSAFGLNVQRRRVLYLDYEMVAEDLAERLESMGYDSADALADLRYALLPSLPAADSPEGGRAITRLAELVDADVVVLDTFSRAVEGDENDADTVRAFYRWTGLHLKASGRAFVRIDHAGKDAAKGQRGTSAKNDDVDVVWQMSRTDGGARLTAKKKRMGWVPETVDLTISDDPLGYDMTSRPGWPVGTSETAAILDELDVDITLSTRKVGPLVRDAGHRVTNAVLRAAVRYRRECADLDSLSVETPLQGVGKARRRDSGAPPLNNRSGAAPARGVDKAPKDQHTPRAEDHSARAGAPPEPQSGAPPLPSSGAPGGPTSEVDTEDTTTKPDPDVIAADDLMF